MGDGFKVDPAKLRQAATSMDSGATQVGQLVQNLTATVTSGSPWGNDEAGTIFGGAYTALLSHALDVLGSHVEQLAEARDGLTTWATTKTMTDEQQAELFQSLASGLEG